MPNHLEYILLVEKLICFLAHFTIQHNPIVMNNSRPACMKVAYHFLIVINKNTCHCEFSLPPVIIQKIRCLRGKCQVEKSSINNTNTTRKTKLLMHSLCNFFSLFLIGPHHSFFIQAINNSCNTMYTIIKKVLYPAFMANLWTLTVKFSPPNKTTMPKADVLLVIVAFLYICYQYYYEK